MAIKFLFSIFEKQRDYKLSWTNCAETKDVYALEVTSGASQIVPDWWTPAPDTGRT
ncbi:MAG: hypothetical protein ABI288_10560 [Ginsengibacter sp.]